MSPDPHWVRRWVRAVAVAAIATFALSAVAPVATTAAVVSGTPGWPSCDARATPIHLGLRVVHRTAVSARVTDITFHSDAMQADEHVDVLVPRRYDGSGRTRYPVMYLLHGAFGSHTDWVDHGLAAMLGNRRFIAVMPDDGPDGSYSDWYGTEAGFPGPAPAWDSFHVRELMPWIERHYPIAHGRRNRVIAGLSSGGSGAMKYATQNPGRFAAVGSFSGAVDVNLPGYHSVAEASWDATYAPTLGPPGHCTWGDPALHPVLWHSGDPTFLTNNLRRTALFVASGDGQPGPYDQPGTPPDATETEIWHMNQAFNASLDKLKIPHATYFYGPGTHTWPYWERDFRHFLRWLPAHLKHPDRRPSSFNVQSAQEHFSAWGWRFEVRRAVPEFLYLRHVSRHGLEAAGSGWLRLTTAAVFRPGGRYVVTGAGSHSVVTATSRGRLRATVLLGPSHTVEQNPASLTAPSGWRHVRLRIRRAPR